MKEQLAAKNFERASELIDANDYHPALELLREAVRFSPDKAEYRFRLGQVELKNVNWIDRGLEDLREATRLAPTRGDFLRETARALAEHGRTEDARMYARKAQEVEPGSESAALLAELKAEPAQQAEPKPTRSPGLLARLLKRKGGS